jgi:hypothetical protein
VSSPASVVVVVVESSPLVVDGSTWDVDVSATEVDDSVELLLDADATLASSAAHAPVNGKSAQIAVRTTPSPTPTSLSMRCSIAENCQSSM